MFVKSVRNKFLEKYQNFEIICKFNHDLVQIFAAPTASACA